MTRRTGLIITAAVAALILALQLTDSDRILMRLLNLRLPSQASRAFTPILPKSVAFSTSTSTMASKDEAAPSVLDTSAEARDPTGVPLGLPAPGEAEAVKLDMSSGGDTVRLDSLGPMVVNKDGTISRIGNWQQMTELEQKNTLRIVGKRNKQRLDALKTAEGATEPQ